MIFAGKGREGVVLKDRKEGVMNVRKYQGQDILTGPKLAVGTLAVIVALALAIGTTSAAPVGASSEVDEKAKLELISVTWFRHLEGDATLQLQIAEPGESSFQAKARVKDGAIEHILYSMWLSGRGGDAVLLDTDVAEERCVFDRVRHKVKCEVTGSLKAELEQAPFDVTTLRGLTINIKEHFGRFSPVVLTGTVRQFELDSRSGSRTGRRE